MAAHMAQDEQDEPVGLESGSGSGRDAAAVPGQPPPACTPGPAGTRGDVSLPVTPARLQRGRITRSRPARVARMSFGC